MDITINLDHEELQKALENGTLAALVQKCSYGGNAVIEPVSTQEAQAETISQ